MATITPDKTLDASGLNCPLPVLKTKKALEELQSGAGVGNNNHGPRCKSRHTRLLQQNRTPTLGSSRGGWQDHILCEEKIRREYYG
jgi:hypothetical protein